jgi:hypothetical protein
LAKKKPEKTLVRMLSGTNKEKHFITNLATVPKAP